MRKFENGNLLSVEMEKIGLDESHFFGLLYFLVHSYFFGQ